MRMEIIGEIVASVFVLSIVLLLVFWVWAGYHVIKCHRVNNCNNRKCKYWQFCKHNEYERKKDQLLWRVQMMEKSTGEDLSEIKDKIMKKQ